MGQQDHKQESGRRQRGGGGFSLFPFFGCYGVLFLFFNRFVKRSETKRTKKRKTRILAAATSRNSMKKKMR